MTATRPNFTATLKIIWAAICLSMGIITFVSWKTTVHIEQPFDWNAFMPFLGVIFVSFVASWFLPAFLRKSIDARSSEFPQDTVERLFVPFIVRWALTESTVVIALAASVIMSTPAPSFYVLPLALGWMIMGFPSLEKLKKDDV